MALHEHRRNCQRIDAPSAERLGDDEAGVALVGFLDLLRRKLPGTGDGAVEVVGVGRAVAGEIQPRLRRGDGVARMGVHRAADAGEGIVKREMRRKVGGRAELALHDMARAVRDDHIAGLHIVIRYAARLDDNVFSVLRERGDVAPCEHDEAVFYQLEILFADSFLQIFKHDVPP